MTEKFLMIREIFEEKARQRIEIRKYMIKIEELLMDQQTKSEVLEGRLAVVFSRPDMRLSFCHGQRNCLVVFSHCSSCFNSEGPLGGSRRVEGGRRHVPIRFRAASS